MEFERNKKDSYEKLFLFGLIQFPVKHIFSLFLLILKFLVLKVLNNCQFTCPGKKLEEGTGIIWTCHKDEDETSSVDDECINYCLM